MIVDTKPVYEFSNAFHQSASTHGGINVIANATGFHIVSCGVTADNFAWAAHTYCWFRCYRDLQTFCAVRGWTIKEVYTLQGQTQEVSEPESSVPEPILPEPESNLIIEEPEDLTPPPNALNLHTRIG